MSLLYTGYKRSLTITITKIIGSTVIYSHIYYGQNLTPYSIISPLEITDSELALMSIVDFNTRLLLLQNYVSSQEGSIDWNNDIVAGENASENDPTFCVLPTTTTTTIPPVPTTTTSTTPPPSTTSTTLAPTTTTTTTIVAYSFAVKYGVWPIDACNGTVGTVYSHSLSPGIGNILYKDMYLTQRWDLGAAVLFTAPNLFGSYVTAICVVTDSPEYSQGEIMMTVGGYDCNATTTTTTTIYVGCKTYDVFNPTLDIINFGYIDCYGDSQIQPVDPSSNVYGICTSSYQPDENLVITETGTCNTTTTTLPPATTTTTLAAVPLSVGILNDPKTVNFTITDVKIDGVTMNLNPTYPIDYLHNGAGIAPVVTNKNITVTVTGTSSSWPQELFLWLDGVNSGIIYMYAADGFPHTYTFYNVTIPPTAHYVWINIVPW